MYAWDFGYAAREHRQLEVSHVSTLAYVTAGARISGLQPAHHSGDLDQAHAPTRPPLSGLRGHSHLQLASAEHADWPSALQPTRSDISMYSSHHVHFTPNSDDANGQHEVHHDPSSPRSHSSQGSRGSIASVATAPPGYPHTRRGDVPTR